MRGWGGQQGRLQGGMSRADDKEPWKAGTGLGEYARCPGQPVGFKQERDVSWLLT